MNYPVLLGAIENLPYDVFVDNVLPRVLVSPHWEDFRTGNELEATSQGLTPRAVLQELLAAIDEYYRSKRLITVRPARVRDLFASLLQVHHSHLLASDIIAVPRRSCVERLFLSDCEELCSSSSDPEWHPTLQWTQRIGRRPMATTLLASQTGTKVILSVERIQIQGNSLKLYLHSCEGRESLKTAMSAEQASVASLALVARRGGARTGMTYGELVFGNTPYCYQQARDALEGSRFTMSEIKSLSSTTSVVYQGGHSVIVDFPDIMESLCGSTGELLLTVGACFVGLDLVHQHAYYPLRLEVLEHLVQSRVQSGQGGVFSRLNRLDCEMGVLAAWEKRMLRN